MQNRNKQFEDYGWEKMRQLLDEEIPKVVVVPASDGRKKWALWLFLLLATIVGGIFYVSPFVKNEPTKSVQQTAPIATSESENITAQNAIVPTENQAIILANIKSQAGVKSEKHSIGKQITFSEKSLSNPSTVSTTFQKVSVQGIENEQVVAANNELETTNRTIESLDFLPCSSIEKLDFHRQLELNLTPIFPIIKAEQTAPKPEIGVFAGVISQQFEDFDGWTSGAFATLPVGQSKFGIRAGIGYKRVQNFVLGDSGSGAQRDFTTPDVNNFIDTSFESTTAVFNDEKAGGSNQFFVYSQKLDYLTVPVSLQYQFAKRWSAFAGVDANFNFNKAEEVPTLSLPLATPNQPVFNSTPPARWDFGASAGIEFSPLKNFGIAAQYRHGFSTVWDKIPLRQQLHYFQLSANYRFQL